MVTQAVAEGRMRLNLRRNRECERKEAGWFRKKRNEGRMSQGQTACSDGRMGRERRGLGSCEASMTSLSALVGSDTNYKVHSAMVCSGRPAVEPSPSPRDNR